jgi:GDSL-like Lipase/Acylhydrolase family
MLATALLAAMLSPAADPPKDPFVFADGDRVVFLGGTLIEREQKYGYWELALTLKNKDKNVSFRNLGWSGDTVWCESRGSFGGQPEGFKKAIELVKELKPTVIVLCYGHVESFDGKDGVKKFTDGLEKLIDAVSVTKARVVLMTPTPFENVVPMTDAEAKNANLKLYTAAMKEVAEKRKLDLYDLYVVQTNYYSSRKPPAFMITQNGMTLSQEGYEESSFGIVPSSDRTDLSPLSGVREQNEKVQIAVRHAIVAKNELFFHRWRPQNLTYLTGFRKHEQGNNAKEIVQFDPLVEKAEKEIAELRKKVK